MEVGGEGDYIYTYRYTVTTRMIPALRWAAMRAILMFQQEVMDSHRTVSTNHNLFEEKGEPKRYRTEVLPLTSLTPCRQAKLAHSQYTHMHVHLHTNMNDILYVLLVRTQYKLCCLFQNDDDNFCCSCDGTAGWLFKILLFYYVIMIILSESCVCMCVHGCASVSVSM